MKVYENGDYSPFFISVLRREGGEDRQVNRDTQEGLNPFLPRTKKDFGDRHQSERRSRGGKGSAKIQVRSGKGRIGYL